MSNGNPAFDGTHRDAADKTAAMVFAGGERFIARSGIARKQFEGPPPMRAPWPNEPQNVGMRNGRLTVLGICIRQGACGPAKWVVRCDCGAIERRTHKALHNAANQGDRCADCDRRLKALKDFHHAKTGQWLDLRAQA
jgi:hypothetical protein